MVLKGATIPACNIVAAGSIITCVHSKHDKQSPIDTTLTDFQAPYNILVGQPMKVAKHNVTWSRDMFYDNEDLLAKYPDAYAQSWFRKGVLLVERGCMYKETRENRKAIGYFADAIAAYEKAITLKADYVYAHCALGNAYILSFSTESNSSNRGHLLRLAQKALTNALKFDPTHTDSLDALKVVKMHMQEKSCTFVEKERV